MNPSIIPVNFHNDTLAIVEHQSQPFVPMKPIVENMGLDWKSQYVKLGEKFNSTVVIITMVAEDGKNREMICMPMRKIPAWLYSISPNKVKPELKDKIIQYQEECDEVLWQHWSQGNTAARTASSAAIGQQLAASRELSRLMQELKKETVPDIREALKAQIQHASAVIGLPVPKVDNIGRSVDPLAPDPMVDEFWEVVDSIGLEKLNHTHQKGVAAINLIHFSKLAEKEGHKIPRLADLRTALRGSVSPRFNGIKTMRSVLAADHTIKCWIFSGRTHSEITGEVK